ncbi:unnamed protein product [Caenorhabditis brenneri]
MPPKKQQKSKQHQQASTSAGGDDDNSKTAVITPTILRQLIINYFPPQLLCGMNYEEAGLTSTEPIYDGGLAIIDKILKNVNTRLQMYGPPSKIVRALKEFRQFEGSQEHLNIDWGDPFMSERVVYLNKNGTEYISRQNLYQWFQHLLSELITTRKGRIPAPQLVHRIGVICLKEFERYELSRSYLEDWAAEGPFEIMPFLEQDIRARFSAFEDVKVINEDDKEEFKFEPNPNQKTFDFVYKTFLKLLEFPNVDSEEEEEEEEEEDGEEFALTHTDELKWVLREHFEENPPTIDPAGFTEISYFTSHYIKILYDLCEKVLKRIFDRKNAAGTIGYVRVFREKKPYGKSSKKATGKDKGNKKTRNISPNATDNEPFVMRAELERAIKLCNIEGESDADESDGESRIDFLTTIPYNEEEFEKKYGNKIVFVNVAIPTVRCRARPIMMLDTDYCILSLHALIQMWHELVFGRKIFQKMDRVDANNFMNKLARLLRKHFTVEKATEGHINADIEGKKCPLFINLEAVKEIQYEIDDLCEGMNEGEKDIQIEDHQPTTPQYLTGRLQMLNIPKTFPETNKKFQELIKKKQIDFSKEVFFKKLEEALFAEFIGRFEPLKEFVLSQAPLAFQ